MCKSHNLLVKYYHFLLNLNNSSLDCLIWLTIPLINFIDYSNFPFGYTLFPSFDKLDLFGTGLELNLLLI
jgi:hypothetical protein